ncbi:hypothetical protein QR680_015369 [Steinernema hermaphroditum]|uniref:Uncharacterized protein n=1 Tax=Steinernema hermaphroditum TaxID=289476 RepID=A0AA39LKG6_9BILA|nr:hypothetical protein QR680_015369 [Steinernema hermaphroditum]
MHFMFFTPYHYGCTLQRSRKRCREELGDDVANVDDTFGFEIPDRFRKAEGINQEKEEDFLLADVNEDGLRAVIFMTDTGRKVLDKYRNIAFDGTFGIVPSHMYQLVTVHAYIEKFSAPLVYCITNKKTKKLYK